MATPSARPDEAPGAFTSVSAGEDWEHGLPVGTGRVGALIHGDPREHRVDLTHEWFFLPANPHMPAPDLQARLPAMRQALLEGDADSAGDLLAEAAEEHSPGGALIWTDPFVPAARLVITDPEADPVPGSRRRDVDLRTGVVEISWQDARRGRQTLRAAPRHGDETIHLSLSSEAPAEFVLRLSSGADDAGADDAGTVDPASRVRATAALDGEHARLRVGARRAEARPADQHETAETTVSPLPAAELHGEGSLVARLPVPAGSAARLQLRVTVDGAPAHDPLLDGTTLPSPPREELAARSVFHLGKRQDTGEPQGAGKRQDTGERPWSAQPTEELLAAARTGDLAAEDALVELVYAASRHTVISSTGMLPPNLTGLWQGTWTPAWSGDYTLNGNVTLGATASMISTGMPELRLSLLRLVSRHLPAFRENARRIFGAEGVLLPARLSTHGHASHFSVGFPHLFWLGGGPWVLRQGWDLFSATGDTALLPWLWSFAQEVMRCCETAVHHHDGVAHLVPSYSPENTPRGAANPLAVDATSDIAAIRDAAVVATRIGRLMGDESHAAGWARLRDSLPVPRLTAEGALAEWAHPGFPDEPHHRHTSHLYPFGTEGDEAFATEEMRAAALATVRQRLAYRESDPPESMEMAFGLCELGVVAARLGDADLALRVVHTLAGNYWRPSMMSTHDPGSILNADASGGFPAVVSAMLLTSGPGQAVLLPALPERWPTGAVTGLCGAEGLVLEELAWDEGRAGATLRRRPGSQAAWPSPRLNIIAGGGWRHADGASSRTVELTEAPMTLELRRG
ncbi:glycoside hydrolase N-terminal domain-containing protein [Nesterenkonia sp. CL21]|uniref:glycosyl hydrolase family 95 catalytic domain-containing protein n=1 Tax=Nesterenkonia sp. CL21 TaxID=3064894 RepID=UPI002879E51F|nr:glycoside hydrolase N-terminal domain-containing protein [Nesterenkonia sp. CL21]MDS2172699.1 glycoside hydrolase N-terminal domain-containing protein [Nesterenkonia sp. CL21]